MLSIDDSYFDLSYLPYSNVIILYFCIVQKELITYGIMENTLDKSEHYKIIHIKSPDYLYLKHCKNSEFTVFVPKKKNIGAL